MNHNLQKAERVWQTVNAIPIGKVASYGQIADLAGLPGRARWIGKAMSCAPHTMQLPWHRVIRSNGQLAFDRSSQHGQTQSETLIAEGVPVIKHRVNMAEFMWQPNLSEILEKLDFSHQHSSHSLT